MISGGNFHKTVSPPSTIWITSKHRSNQGGNQNMPLLTRPHQGADRQHDHQYTHNACHIAVELLKKGVIVYSRQRPDRNTAANQGNSSPESVARTVPPSATRKYVNPTAVHAMRRINFIESSRYWWSSG